MNQIDVILKVFGIQEQYREEIEDMLKTTSPENLMLALSQYAQHPDDDDFDPTIDEWMDKHFSSLKFV